MTLNPEQFVGYHHTNRESADSILKHGFDRDNGWVYFRGSPDPDMNYGEAVVELSVDPKHMEIDERSPVGQDWQRKSEPARHTGNWGKDVYWVAPASAVTPTRIHDFTGNRQNKWSGKDHVSDETHEWDDQTETFVKKK